MGLLQGALLTGAAATGVVVAERVRHRGSGADVREDVTEFGTTVAERVGKAAGFVGHAGGKVLGTSADVAESLADRTSQLVFGAGRTIARGAGATMGAYAGAIDRVLPTFGRSEEPATAEKAPAKPAAKKAPAKPATKKSTPAGRA